MRTDTDHPARVGDPAVELFLTHMPTLTNEWSSRPPARRGRLARIEVLGITLTFPNRKARVVSRRTGWLWVGAGPGE